MVRILSVIAGVKRSYRLVETLSEELDRILNLAEEIEARAAGRAPGVGVPPAWGVVCTVRDGGRNEAGRAVFHLDGAPVALGEVDAQVLRSLLEPGGVRSEEGLTYKPVSHLTTVVAERLSRPPQSGRALAASICRIKRALGAVRTDARALIQYSRCLKGYRLAMADRGDDKPGRAAAPVRRDPDPGGCPAARGRRAAAATAAGR